MATEIVFETHSLTDDNDAGRATGWHGGRLSARGRVLAAELGARRRNDGIRTVFTSDLARAWETTRIAFAGSSIPVLADWRLRECDYGDWNGASSAKVHGDRSRHFDAPYPGGESWRDAIRRVGLFLDDVPLRWGNTRVLVIGHVATRWAFEHLLNGVPLEHLAAAEFAWREGWEFRLR